MLTYDNLFPTGINELDGYLEGGFRPGCLCYIASRTGMDKTSLAVQIAVGGAKSGKNVCFFSLEESAEHIKTRIALQGGEKLPITVDDTTFITVQYIKERLKELGNIDMVFVDYMLLMSTEKKADNRIIEASEVSYELKLMAKELRIPVVSCTLLPRQGCRPELSDLRRFGSLEQDADVAILLYHEEIDLETSKINENKTESEIIIAKNRYGECGTINAVFDGKKLLFRII